MTELSQIVAGWPLVLSMAAAVAAQGLRAGRRRLMLNEALHELRRPLQAAAFAAGGAGAGEEPIRLATAALERLDREINGRPPLSLWSALDPHDLIRAAVGRWQARAEMSQASLEMRWSAGRVELRGDRHALGQALDNLIVNALEHGGPTIVVAGRVHEGKLRIAVVDSGSARRSRSRRSGPAWAISRLAGQQRHGHGLAVVRRVADEHRGRFAIRRSEGGTLAVLELPLLEAEGGLAA
jgi:signal transduction histidine kinase